MHPLPWKLAAVALGAVLTLSAWAQAQTHAEAFGQIDLTPAQADRIHADRDPAAIQALPKDFKFVTPGTLTVAIAAAVPPTSTYATDAKTIVGADADHAHQLAEALGLKLNLVTVAWPDWPLGLVSGKYDAVISNVGVTEERKRKFDFSTYRLGLHGFFVRNDSPIHSIKEPKDIAGLKIITSSGSIQERILLEWNKLNIAAGRKPVELLYFDDLVAAKLALESGRADAHFNPHGPLAYLAAKERKTREVGTVNAGWPLKADVAVATRKGSGLAAALTAATNTLIHNGKYAQTLARWGLSQEAVAQSETNPLGLPSF
ncbi:MAG: transporter substrate-binding domain-containing protein [Paucibacter sp.]|nr:transporter substrate-binding domain-containing protein [Roseateles sp.]